MLRHVLRALLVLTVLFVGSAPSSAQLHKDERLGFQVKLPKKWTQVPLQSDEQWVVAKFACDKTDFFTDDSLGYTFKHNSTLRIVAFVDQFIQAAEEVEEDQDDDEEGEASSTASVRLRTVYRDYDEFLKENFDGGYFIQEDTQGKHGELEVRHLQILAEASMGTGPRLLHTWIYTTDIGAIAVEFEVLEDKYTKKKSSLEKTFRSFKPIARTQALTMASSASNFTSIYALNRLSLEERNATKRSLHAKRWGEMQANLLDGWEALEIGEFRVLTCHDKKHAKEVVGNMEAIMGWLDDEFPFIGPGEYVRPPFIRICKDREEESQLRDEDAGVSFSSGEVITHKDQGGATGYEWRYIKDRAVDVWFYERDWPLYLGLPNWLKIGLKQVMSGAKIKGTKIKFERNFWERGFQDDQEAWGLEQVMRMSTAEINSSRQRAGIQSAALTRFLIDGAGSKGKHKGFLADYMKNLSAIIDEMEAEDDAERAAREEDDESDEPETEEEEDAMLKERKERFAQRERRIMDEAYSRTVAGRSEGQMDALKKAYLKEVK